MENISYGKIVLIGAGHVGSAILDSLLRMNLADEIVVINRNEKKALDGAFHSSPGHGILLRRGQPDHAESLGAGRRGEEAVCDRRQHSDHGPGVPENHV